MILQLNPFPKLITDRLELRCLAMNDADNLLKLRSDERVNKYLGRPNTITIAQTEKFIDKIERTLAEKQGAYWAISLKGETALIGTICYWNLEWDTSSAEIGYELMPEYHGKGLMQEAIKKVVAYGFNQMELEVITALPDRKNEKSIVLLERNDFKIDKNFKYVTKEDAGEQVVYYLIRKQN